jgi:hypothetical protein
VGCDDAPVTEDEDRAPICPYCGVTALPAEGWGDAGFVCENPDCEAYGDTVVAGDS